jgi:ATP-dependent Zn protease
MLSRNFRVKVKSQEVLPYVHVPHAFTLLVSHLWPIGTMLYGPPGTGRILLESVKGRELLNMNIAAGEANVWRVFP